MFGLGNVLNKFLELIFFKFNLESRAIYCFQNIKSSEIMSKSLIIPAKNEEKILEVLFEKLPHIEKLNEIVLFVLSLKTTLFKLQTVYQANMKN